MMMPRTDTDKSILWSYVMILCLIALFGLWARSMSIETPRQKAGLIIFSLGFALLSAYVLAKMVRNVRLPEVSGYILAGVLAGPCASEFLTVEMVARLRLIDDLALSFIALMAGAELRLNLISRHFKSIFWSMAGITVLVTGLVMASVLMTGHAFDITKTMAPSERMIFAVLSGLICVTLSPASAIAVIRECGAKGPFTAMTLAVIVALDVLIIIFFTIALSLSEILATGGSLLELTEMSGLIVEILASLILGVGIGYGVTVYMAKFRRDLLMFLLFVTFAVARLSMEFNHFMGERYDLSLHLEPLLIFMSAGFFIQNFSQFGGELMENLGKMALPIYALFFSLAGASLDFYSLMLCWPLALLLVAVRAVGLIGGSRLAGVISGDPPMFTQYAWLTYVPQAGVSIGLAQIAARQFPEIGIHLSTLVLGIIAVNQMIGPVTYKLALTKVGETPGE